MDNSVHSDLDPLEAPEWSIEISLQVHNSQSCIRTPRTMVSFYDLGVKYRAVSLTRYLTHQLCSIYFKDMTPLKEKSGVNGFHAKYISIFSRAQVC